MANERRLRSDFKVFEVETFPVDDEAALRRELAPLERKKPDWSEMSDLQRRALVLLVSDALAVLQEDIDRWLPDALVAHPRSGFGLFVYWKFGHVDEAVLAMAADAERRAGDALAYLQQLARE